MASNLWSQIAGTGRQVNQPLPQQPVAPMTPSQPRVNQPQPLPPPIPVIGAPQRRKKAQGTPTAAGMLWDPVTRRFTKSPADAAIPGPPPVLKPNSNAGFYNPGGADIQTPFDSTKMVDYLFGGLPGVADYSTGGKPAPGSLEDYILGKPMGGGAGGGAGGAWGGGGGGGIPVNMQQRPGISSDQQAKLMELINSGRGRNQGFTSGPWGMQPTTFTASQG